MERDKPGSVSSRGRLSGRGQRSREAKPPVEAVAAPDRAYEREYLAHDRKRIKRE